MKDNKILAMYEKRKARFEVDLADKEKLENSIVVKRTLVAIGIISLLVYCLWFKQILYSIAIIPLVAYFIYLIIQHNKVESKIEFLKLMIDINEESMQRMTGEWKQFKDRGDEFISFAHPYSNDLDIFGQGSLYQYINATTFTLGANKLKEMISSPEKWSLLKARQMAIKELADLLDWRQRLQALGKKAFLKEKDISEALAWISRKPVFIKEKFLIKYLPYLTILFFICILVNKLFLFAFLFLLLLQTIIILRYQSTISEVFGNMEKIEKQLANSVNLFKHIENTSFKAELLMALRWDLTHKGITASQQIKILAKLIDRTTVRYSPVLYFLLNLFFLFDLKTMLKLEEWKKTCGAYLPEWFEVLANLEALASLSIIVHDNPAWIYPVVEEGKIFLEAQALGHPLIDAETRIDNDISLEEGAILLITGSNMSGKSTFLRTIGINLVLAYAGASVCASKFHCSVMDIFTSMKIQDNLEEKTSSFYAELKRMKAIIDYGKADEPFIFLLDEIFRGTNSKDRVYGAKSVVKELAKRNCIGLVTTHDLEISDLERDMPKKIKNYHFTDKMRDGEVVFDYKLKQGVSTSTNAVELMKALGIIK